MGWWRKNQTGSGKALETTMCSCKLFMTLLTSEEPRDPEPSFMLVSSFVFTLITCEMDDGEAEFHWNSSFTAMANARKYEKTARRLPFASSWVSEWYSRWAFSSGSHWVLRDARNCCWKSLLASNSSSPSSGKRFLSIFRFCLDSSEATLAFSVRFCLLNCSNSFWSLGVCCSDASASGVSASGSEAKNCVMAFQASGNYVGNMLLLLLLLPNNYIYLWPQTNPWNMAPSMGFQGS